MRGSRRRPRCRTPRPRRCGSSRQRSRHAAERAGRRARPLEMGERRRRARSCRPGRRPRSTCCRPSCGPPSTAADRGAGVLDDVAGGAVGADLADRAEDQVLGGARPGRARPRSRIRIVCGSPLHAGIWVASTCSTSLVPIPNASAPNAPCVAVCESPHTIVIPGWVTPELGADHVHDALAAIEPSEYTGIPNSAQLRSSVCHLHARQLVADPGRPACRRWATLWSAVASVRSGRLTRRPASAQPVERLRAGHLVHQVQVDVEQAAPHRRGRPRSCRTASVASAPPQAGAENREQHGFLRTWIFKMMIQVRVERDAVAIEQLVPLAVAVQDDRPALDECRLAAARLVPGRVPGPSGRRPRRQRVARELGALARQRRGEDLVAVARDSRPAPSVVRIAARPSRRRPRRAAAVARGAAPGRRRSAWRPGASGWSRRARPARAWARSPPSARPGRAATGPSPRAAP